MWIYVVVLIQLGQYRVHAPNIVFKLQDQCVSGKKLDTGRLESTAPSPDHKVISMCVQLPQEA